MKEPSDFLEDKAVSDLVVSFALVRNSAADHEYYWGRAISDRLGSCGQERFTCGRASGQDLQGMAVGPIPVYARSQGFDCARANHRIRLHGVTPPPDG